MAKKGIVQSAAILTVSGVINRLLGFVYRIYMSNVIGAEGMGLYQLIMPIYSLAWSISCSGFTTTVSKLTASEKAKGETGNMGRILKQSLIITTGLGAVIGAVLFFGAALISNKFFNDPRLIMPLKILSISFPFMAAGSCIRGYFHGLQEAMVPAISQVFEQVVRMVVIYILSSSFIPLGLEYACAVAVIGILAGEFLSFLMIIASYRSFKRKNKYIKKPAMSASASLMLILSMSLPLTLNRVSGSFLLTVENMLLPQKLQLFGLTASQSIQELGKVSGMAMPLIMFPSAMLVSLSISLVPAISAATAVNDYKRISSTVSKVMLFTSIVGIGASGLFILFSDLLGQVIYKEDIAEIMVYLGIMCPFLYMQTTLSGILNGLGEQVFIFRNSLLSSAISIFFVWFAVPVIGIKGYILGSFLSLAVVCALEVDKIKELSGMKIDYINWYIKPAICIVWASLMINFIKAPLCENLGNITGVIISILLLGIIYLTSIFLTGSVSKEDLQLMSKKQ